MKAIILTILLLGLCGAVGADWEDPVYIMESEDSTPILTHLLADSIVVGVNSTPACCTVFVVDTVWMMPIIPDYETVSRPIPLWMWFRWQQIEAILDSSAPMDLYE